MKKNLFYTVMMAMVVMMTACSSDDVLESVQPTQENGESGIAAQAKTVLVYIAGRNDLTDYVPVDLNEMKEGSKHLGNKDNLLVFVRKYNDGAQPWLARIQNGAVTDSVSLSDMGITRSDGENRASDPVVMDGVLHYAFSHYPATGGNYGLVLWGHGSGWLMENEVTPLCSRAYGVDHGKSTDDKSSDGRWINIPSLAKILSDMPHLKFIMADCCNFMCLENLYELRNVCDYIIGSPAEVPDQGAPYDQIVPDMFADGNFYTPIIDKYFKSVFEYLPLTAVKTSEMEHVAQATRQAMQAVNEKKGEDYADMTGMIHYYHTDFRGKFNPDYNIFYDAGNFFLTYAPQEVYQQWKQVLDKAIVEYRKSMKWNTDKPWYSKYSDFTATEEKMHGVSMFVEQDPVRGNYAKYNENIKKMAWWKAVN